MQSLSMKATKLSWFYVSYICLTCHEEGKAKNIEKLPCVLAAEPLRARLAKVKVDSNFTAPCNTSILYPADGGNMHRFTAVTACAVLDVLGPPYSDADGRPCTYYSDHPFSRISGA